MTEWAQGCAPAVRTLCLYGRRNPLFLRFLTRWQQRFSHECAPAARTPLPLRQAESYIFEIPEPPSHLKQLGGFPGIVASCVAKAKWLDEKSFLRGDALEDMRKNGIIHASGEEPHPETAHDDDCGQLVPWFSHTKWSWLNGRRMPGLVLRWVLCPMKVRRKASSGTS